MEGTTPAASAPATEAGSSPVIQNDGGAQAQPGQQADKAAPSAPAKPEYFEIKVDGKVLKLTKDEMIQHASMGHAAQKRFAEAAQMRKQAESLLGRLRDPKQAIQLLQDPSLGLSKDQIREQFEEWYAKEFIEPEKLTPEQRKLKEYEAKIEEYANQEKSREEQKRTDEQEKLTTQERERIKTQIMEAIDSGKLPKTNFTIKRLAYWMQKNHQNGFNAPTEVLIGQVKNEINSSLRALVESSDGEVLINILGDGIIQKLRKYDLDQLRKMRGGGQPQPAETTSEQRRNEPPPSTADVNRRIRELQRSGQY